MRNWIQEEKEWWWGLTKAQKSHHLTRVLLSLFLVGLGAMILTQNITLEIFLGISGFFSILGAEILAYTMIACGVIIFLIKRMTLLQIFIFTFPILVYFSFSWRAYIRDEVRLSSPFFLTILYLLLLVNFWGWEDGTD